jgi:hypothetical protein
MRDMVLLLLFYLSDGDEISTQRTQRASARFSFVFGIRASNARSNLYPLKN